MSNYIQIQWTCNHLEEARSIAKELVEKKLVACVSILPHVESIFSWKGEIQVEQEVKVFLKTKDRFFDQVREYLLQKAKYEVPEILKFSILDGHKPYFDWMESNLKS